MTHSTSNYSINLPQRHRFGYAHPAAAIATASSNLATHPASHMWSVQAATTAFASIAKFLGMRGRRASSIVHYILSSATGTRQGSFMRWHVWALDAVHGFSSSLSRKADVTMSTASNAVSTSSFQRQSA